MEMNIICNDIGVKVLKTNGHIEEIKWDEIVEVLIVTTDKGPFEDDLFLCLSSIDGKSGCAIPSSVEGYDCVYEKVSKFEEFNFNNYIKAMSCAANDKFLCWKRR